MESERSAELLLRLARWLINKDGLLTTRSLQAAFDEDASLRPHFPQGFQFVLRQLLLRGNLREEVVDGMNVLVIV